MWWFFFAGGVLLCIHELLINQFTFILFTRSLAIFIRSSLYTLTNAVRKKLNHIKTLSLYRYTYILHINVAKYFLNN